MAVTPRTSTTLTQFLIEQRRRFPDASGNFNALMLDVALACKAIAKSVAYGALADLLGHHPEDGGSCVNVQGETQQKLDKDRFRRDLGNVEDAYREILKRLTGEIL